MVVKVRIGKKEYYTNEKKADELIKKYKKDHVVLKEAAGQVIIMIGGVFLGAVATDIANRIASELE